MPEWVAACARSRRLAGPKVTLDEAVLATLVVLERQWSGSSDANHRLLQFQEYTAFATAVGILPRRSQLLPLDSGDFGDLPSCLSVAPGCRLPSGHCIYDNSAA